MTVDDFAFLPDVEINEIVLTEIFGFVVCDEGDPEFGQCDFYRADGGLLSTADDNFATDFVNDIDALGPLLVKMIHDGWRVGISTDIDGRGTHSVGFHKSPVGAFREDKFLTRAAAFAAIAAKRAEKEKAR